MKHLQFDIEQKDRSHHFGPNNGPENGKCLVVPGIPRHSRGCKVANNLDCDGQNHPPSRERKHYRFDVKHQSSIQLIRWRE